MNREMEHINVLAGEIGYRVATTEGEHRAANYIEQELHNYGLQEVRQEAFRSSSEGVSGFFPYILALIGSSLIAPLADRKSTRLNSSHTVISYAVFCLKK